MKTKILILTITLVFLHTFRVSAQQTIVDEFEKRSQTFQGVTLPYRLFVPAIYDSTRSYPLVLALHGAGERGTDNEVHIRVHRLATSWADPVNQAAYPAFVVAPQVPPSGRWTADLPVDQSSFNGFQSTTLDILDSLAAAYNIDLNRVYVTGLSMGGHGAWDFVSRLPNRFAAVVPMSGNADPTQADEMLHLPIWAFHGENDTVVPASGSRGLVYAAENLGREILYTDCRRSLPLAQNFDCPGPLSSAEIAQAINNHADFIYTGARNVGHGPWNVWYDHPLLNDWLFSQYRIDPQALQLMSPAKGDVWSGEETVNWSFSGAVSDSVEIWLTLDNGAVWQEVDSGINGAGQFLLDMALFEDTPFAKLRMFVKNEAGFVYGRHTSEPFIINNDGDAAPFLSLDDEDVRFSEAYELSFLNLPVLASDPEASELSTQVFYSIDNGSTYAMMLDTLLISSQDEQVLKLNLVSWPNSAEAKIKVEISDGMNVNEVETASFVKRTTRAINDYVLHVAGEGVGKVEMHFVEPEKLTGHRYQITFSMADTAGIKTYSVEDLDLTVMVLQNIALSDGVTESPLFDGVRLVVEDLQQGAPNLEATGWQTGSSTMGITISGGNTTLALQTVPLLETETDYEIVFATTIVDTSQALFALPAQGMQFTVRGKADGMRRKVLYKDLVKDGRPSSSDVLHILEESTGGELAPAWEIRFSTVTNTVFPAAGDVFLFTPFRKLSPADVFEFIAAEGVSVEKGHTLNETGLQSVFPNPFLDEITIAFKLEQPARVTVSMFDILGRMVVQRESKKIEAGEHMLDWQLGNAETALLASGIYMIRFSVTTVSGSVINQHHPIVRIR